MKGNERGYFDIHKTRRTIIKAYAIALAIGIPYLIFVLMTDLRIPCVFYELTGLLCPGCGVTRMFMSLARLHFFDAYSYNRAFLFLLVFWNLIALFAYAGKPKLIRSRKFLFAMLVATTVFLTLFGFLRNIY